MSSAKPIIVLGTASHSGKSVITAGLCRVLFQAGVKVAPFKAQNMALNSFTTTEGLEMGRAQVTQAEASGLIPEADMNPILLKPVSDVGAQVIIQGRVYGNMNAVDYHHYKQRARRAVMESYNRLAERFEVIVCEGAGSPAEVNLRENDLVNMGLAEMIDAPCLLVGDIDRGGVFASLVGTLELLTPAERERIKGLIINKFRGDVSLLTSGLDFLTDRTGKPVWGVMPMLSDLGLPEEDGVAVERTNLRPGKGRRPVRAAVIRLPHIANFTDFDALAAEPDVELIWVNPPDPLPRAEAIILPGTKNTLGDLEWLKAQGYDRVLAEHHRRGGLVVGVCGGYQMLGTVIEDPLGVETDLGRVDGLGLIEVRTTMAGDKMLRQTKARARADLLGRPAELTGYEIHMGRSDLGPGLKPAFELIGDGDRTEDGAVSEDGLVWGTYLHGLFDNDDLRRLFVGRLFQIAGLEPPTDFGPNYAALKEAAFNRLAETMRANLDLTAIYRAIGL